MNREIVINTATGLVLRHGYADFATMDDFDNASESIIRSNFIFEPSIKEMDWVWNGSIFIQANMKNRSIEVTGSRSRPEDALKNLLEVLAREGRIVNKTTP